MRFSSALGALVLAACQPSASPPPEGARCTPSVPETAEHPIAVRAGSLAGDYDLIQVQSQPVSGVVIAGRLRLAPLDSASRAAAVGGAVRDLAGRFEPESDPRAGGREAVLAGQHLRLGRAGDPEGTVQNLTITAVAREGFWGWWKTDGGLAITVEPGTSRAIPDPAGYFCALRRRQVSPQ